MVEPLRRCFRNGIACGSGLDEIVTSVEQQAEFAFLNRFRFVNFVNVRQQGDLGDKHQQADADNAHRGQKSIYRHDIFVSEQSRRMARLFLIGSRDCRISTQTELRPSHRGPVRARSSSTGKRDCGFPRRADFRRAGIPPGCCPRRRRIGSRRRATPEYNRR